MLSIRSLIWDNWNVPHIAHHNVVPDEVEEVCFGMYALREGYKGRIMIIGPTKAERMLVVVLDPKEEEGVYYVVTARPADRKERRIYQEEIGYH